jgi:RimJ/RimL family protein N-acetyltransferase
MKYPGAIHIVTTNRLQGEAINPSHWPIWKEMGSNPILMATLGGVWDEKRALEKLESNISHWNKHGFGQWMFFDKENHDFVGRCGLRYMEVEGAMEAELGYSVMPQHWRNGYATEMGNIALEVGFIILKLENIVAFTTTTNIASQKTMQKLGFVYEKNMMRESLEHVLYRINLTQHRN